MTLGKAGVASDAPGLFDQPTDVAVAANGDIFVTEGHLQGNNRISKFSKDGKFIKSWGKKGSGPGEFFAPHTIAIDSRGRLFVGDRSNNRIQIFDQDGRYLDTWTQWGRPSGIFIAKDDTMYVADSESYGPDQPGVKKGIRIGSAKDGSMQGFHRRHGIDHHGTQRRRRRRRRCGGQRLRRRGPPKDAGKTHQGDQMTRGNCICGRWQFLASPS